MRLVHFVHVVSALLLQIFCVPAGLFGQAWLFPQGEGTVATSYQSIHVRDHAFALGESKDVGHTLSHTAIADVDYSLTSKLAIRMGLPFVAGRYNGTKPHLPDDRPSLDDGAYHATFQDFSIDLRYNVSTAPIMVTPFFKAVIPSHAYEYFAHSAAGRDQHEYQIGTNLGRRLDPLLPQAYIQARYSYAFIERVLGIAPNRSDTEAQLGYFLTPRLSVLATTQWTHTHRGVECRFEFHCGLPDDQWFHHDQIAKANLLEAGGGAVFAATRSSEIFVSAGRSVAGRNTHLHAAVVTIGISRVFGSGLREIGASSWAGAPAPTKPLVCTCARVK
jgi:hypothetical protein